MNIFGYKNSSVLESSFVRYTNRIVLLLFFVFTVVDFRMVYMTPGRLLAIVFMSSILVCLSSYLAIKSLKLSDFGEECEFMMLEHILRYTGFSCFFSSIFVASCFQVYDSFFHKMPIEGRLLFFVPPLVLLFNLLNILDLWIDAFDDIKPRRIY